MTAEAAGHVMWSPNPVRQRLANYFLEDVLNLADDAPRVDRLEKPAEYAAAGIPHYWRIEQDPLHVFAYDLTDGKYELAGDSGIELLLSKPFEIRLPIRDIAP